MKESAFWDSLRGQLPAGIHYSRIESETSPGFPDVHYTLNGASGTLELKVARRPQAKKPFSGKDQGLNQSQIDWILEEIEADGTVYIIARVGRKTIIVYGDYADHFNESTLDELAEIGWVFGPRDDLAKFLAQLLRGSNIG